MKKFIYMAVAAIAALSSCTKDDAILNEGGLNKTGVTTFTATIEGDGATRATYNATAKKAEWEATTDQISIGGAVYTAQTTGATTTFTGTGAAKGADQKYHAYFPASLYSGTTASLPATMPLEDGKFNMPMYAESETEVFTFKNLCGVLAITVPNSQMSSVKSIEVSSDQQLNGEIDNVTAEGVLTFKDVTLTDAHKKLTLTAASPIAIPAEGSKTFYVPVPANTHNPLVIAISDGTNIKGMITKKADGVQVARSTMYPITFAGTPLGAWDSRLTLGKTGSSAATSIVIETGVASLPTAEDDTHKKLNEAGTLWQVLDGAILKIQTSAPKIKRSVPTSTSGLFEGYKKATSITGLDKIDFSEVTNMSSMFYGCNSLTSLDLSSFNTSKVTSMKSMFDGCKALTSLDLSSFNTSEVTDMEYMFFNCNALTSLDLSSFNTSKVTSMINMFQSCEELTSLDLSSFNTSNVPSMKKMFNDCNALTSLNLSSFNTSEVTNMESMFDSCKKLSSLTLSNNFVMTNVGSKGYMFYNCGKDLSGSDKCTVSGATGDKDTAGTVKYELSHNTNWNDTYMQFAD